MFLIGQVTLHAAEHLGVEREIPTRCFTMCLGSLSTPQEKTRQLILDTDILYMKHIYSVFFCIHFFLYFLVLPCQTVTRPVRSAAGPVSRSACHVPTQLPCSGTATASPTAAPDSTVRTPSATVNYITNSFTFRGRVQRPLSRLGCRFTAAPPDFELLSVYESLTASLPSVIE